MSLLKFLALPKVDCNQGIILKRYWSKCHTYFSASQALMAAKAGAMYVSPFVGRIDDIGHEGMDLIAQIMRIWEQYQNRNKVLAASIRHPTHILECAIRGSYGYNANKNI